MAEQLHRPSPNLLPFLRGLPSTGQEQSLQAELEGTRALHKRLEEALGRTLERLLRLDSLDANGGGEHHRVTVLPKHAF